MATRPTYPRHRCLVGLWVCALLCGACATTKRSVNADEPSTAKVMELRLKVADQLVQKGDYAGAQPFLRQMKSWYPNSPRVHLLLGIVLREKGLFDASHKALLQARQMAPNSAEVASALGILFDRQRQHPRAEKQHRLAVKLSPKHPEYHNNLGFSLFLQQKYEEASDSVTSALALDPNMRRAYNNLGFIYGMLDRDDQAMRAFSQAGSRSMALTNMGVLAEMQGKPLVARRFYEKALREKAGYKPALNNLRALDPQANRAFQPATVDEKGTIKPTEPASSAAADSQGAPP